MFLWGRLQLQLQNPTVQRICARLLTQNYCSLLATHRNKLCYFVLVLAKEILHHLLGIRKINRKGCIVVLDDIVMEQINKALPNMMVG